MGWILSCTAINILFLRLTAHLNLPIYLDTIGSIFMSFVWGPLSGILVAVLTNIIYGFFIPDSICYSLIGVYVAIRATYFIIRDNKTIKNLIFFIIESALVSGLFGIAIQWLLLGEPQLEYISETARLMAGMDEKRYVIASFILVIGLNFVDKLITVMVAYGMYKLVPVEKRTQYRISKWKQTPLTNAQRKEITQTKEKGKTSLMIKVLIILILVALFTSGVLGVVSTRINYEEAKGRGREMASDMSRFVVTNMDSRYLEIFAEAKTEIFNYKGVRYQQYNEMLKSLTDSIPLLERIYIYYKNPEGVFTILDTDEKFQSSGIVGGKLEDTDSFFAFIGDDKQSIRETIRDFGYKISSYNVVKTDDPNSSFYVIADVTYEDYASFLKRYVIKMILAFSGFFCLIMSSGILMASHNLVYPIGSLEKRIDTFMESIEDQEKLDESVRELEKLDIRTNDELEMLYNSICQMANTTAEQMRSVMMLARSNEKMQAGLVATMADIVESQNIDSKAHIQKTTAYVRIILEGLKRKGYYTEKLTLKYMKDVEMSTPLYDIGKIKIPDSILNKPDALTDEEFEIMKTHTTEGKKILENTISTVEGENYLKEARNMAAYHHEHWDGTGYPEGLHGEVIPLSARIMAIADTFDAVTSLRVYKDAASYQDALEVILDGSGTRFDPKCVEAFEDSFAEVKNVLRKYS
ncbi:MAG: HD domain-containing protein [Butyrivibrio sp.]|nr:HD domain-containing protein [Butyrivibrio sp.]